MPLMSFATVAPQLPESEYVDMEVSTNLVLEQGRHVGSFNLRMEFCGTPSNTVEAVIGTDVRLPWDPMDGKLLTTSRRFGDG